MRLSRLPTTAYRALVQSAPSFTQSPEVDDLYRRVRAGTLSDTQMRQELEVIAAQGRRLTARPGW